VPMCLATIRKAVNDLQIYLAVQALNLHTDDLYCAVSTHAYIISERPFTLQEVGCG